MTDITCRKCGNTYPDTPEYWYFHNGSIKKPCKECQKAAERARQARYRKNHRRKKPDPRPCRYCGKLFTPESNKANRRKHCYHPDCIALAHRQYDPEKREATRQWKVRNGNHKTQLKICPLCGKRRMPPQNHFSCLLCRNQAGMIEGNYIYYESYGYEKEAEL